MLKYILPTLHFRCMETSNIFISIGILNEALEELSRKKLLRKKKVYLQ